MMQHGWTLVEMCSVQIASRGTEDGFKMTSTHGSYQRSQCHTRTVQAPTLVPSMALMALSVSSSFS